MCRLCDISIATRAAVASALRPTFAHLERLQVAISEKWTPAATQHPNLANLTGITREMLLAAIALWDTHVPDHRGLLNASVLDPSRPPTGDFPTSVWQFNPDTRTYVDTRTGTVLSDADWVTLRDRFSDALQVSVRAQGDTFTKGHTPINDWANTFRDTLAVGHLAEYLLATGGANMWTGQNRETLIDTINRQLGYFRQFLNQILRGELSIAQILARLTAYIHAIVESFERGTAQRYALILPAYPADGSQLCLSRCRCHWRVESHAREWHAFWTLDPAAQHCATCLENAEKWNPYIQMKGEFL